MNSSDEGLVGMDISVAGSDPVLVFPASAGVPALVCCDDDGACCVLVMAMYVRGAWCESVRVWR